MKNAFVGGWFRAARYAAAVALLCGSQISWGEDKAPAGTETPASDREAFVPREDFGPALPVAGEMSSQEPLYKIPSNLADPAFKHFVDMNLLGDAYINNDAALMVDVGLQLMEAERVLVRSLDGLTAKDILDVGLRMAGEQHDTVTLDRLNKVAEKLGDKEFSAKLAISLQLASQSRAAAPPIPEASDKLSLNDVFTLREQVLRLERARAVGDLQDLQKLQAELKASTLDAGELNDYLKKEVSAQIATLSPAEANPDPVVKLLGDLSGASRGVTPFRMEALGGSVYRGALPYQLDLANNKIYIDLPTSAPQSYDINSLAGLKGRYGSLFVNYGSFMEIQVDAKGVAIPDGKYETTRTKPGRSITIQQSDPEVVLVHERDPVRGGWWPKPSITFQQAMLMNLETPAGTAGPMRFGCTPIVAANAELQSAARIVATGGGNFTWKQIVAAGGENLTFDQIVAAGGGNMVVTKTGIPVLVLAQTNGNALTVANIVAAGGGNITPAQIVAAGGGNLRPTVPGNITVPASTLQEMWTSVAMKSLIQDGGAYLIGHDGSGLRLIGQDGAGLISNLIGKGGAGVLSKVDGFSGLKYMERVFPRTILSSSGNTYFRAAQRLN